MRKKGFTLIELLVVIAIIGILAATVLIGMRSARSKARDTQRKNNVRSVINMLELYYDDNVSAGYPATTLAATCYNVNGLSDGDASGGISVLVSALNATAAYDISDITQSDDQAARYGFTTTLTGATPDRVNNGACAAMLPAQAQGPVYVGQNMEAQGNAFEAQTAQ
ncbi:MAG: type II secretion system protein [bacterium]|nr:type II secretion system protein [bacterium]